MSEDKRKGDKPVPDNVEQYMNEAQLSELHKIEGFGWKLLFVRHPLFQDPVLVVADANGRTLGVLEEDGRLNLEPDIQTREKHE